MSLVYTDWYLHHLFSVSAFCPRLFMDCFEHTLTLCYVYKFVIKLYCVLLSCVISCHVVSKLDCRLTI